MTAYGSPEITLGALTLGAYRVVSKPFEVQDLATLVQEALIASSVAPAIDAAGRARPGIWVDILGIRATCHHPRRR